MIRTILREPLVHFLALGGALFVGFAWLSPEQPETPKQIRVTQQDVQGLVQSFETAWRRPPTDEERKGLIDAHIRQEVLVREAEALGLDRNDAVIRQRLQQKMEFLLASSANALIPEEAELQAFLHTHADRYRLPAQVAFTQIYLGQTAELGAVDAALAALVGGAGLETLGQTTLLPTTLPLTSVQAIDATFGSGVGGALSEIPMGKWVGPLVSGYGVHLVRVTDRTDAIVPELSEVRGEVEADWREDKADEVVEDLYQDLRAGFDIRVEDAK